MLRIFLIAGLGGLDKNFQPLIDYVLTTAPPSATMMTCAWDDDEMLAAMVESINQTSTDKILVIGHSFGGCAAIELANGDYGDVRKFDRLITLDAKPHGFWEWIQMDHYRFPAPDFAENCTAIFGDFGCGMEDESKVANIEWNDIKHDAFCRDERPLAIVGANIAALTEAA